MAMNTTRPRSEDDVARIGSEHPLVSDAVPRLGGRAVLGNRVHQGTLDPLEDDDVRALGPDER
jgi:hypothetical protein